MHTKYLKVDQQYFMIVIYEEKEKIYCCSRG